MRCPQYVPRRRRPFHLQEPTEVLAMGAVDLAALHAVRELLPRIPVLINEVTPYLSTIRINMAIMERFQHTVRGRAVVRCACTGRSLANRPYSVQLVCTTTTVATRLFVVLQAVSCACFDPCG